jgi:hypothetical protein
VIVGCLRFCTVLTLVIVCSSVFPLNPYKIFLPHFVLAIPNARKARTMGTAAIHETAAIHKVPQPPFVPFGRSKKRS